MSEFGGRVVSGNQKTVAPEASPEANRRLDTDQHMLQATPHYDVNASTRMLRDAQRLRQFCITSQSRCDRSCEAFIARYIGFSVDADERHVRRFSNKLRRFERMSRKKMGMAIVVMTSNTAVPFSFYSRSY